MNEWPDSLNKLRQMTDDDLVRAYDGDPGITRLQRTHIVEELHRRETVRHTQSMTSMTRVITWLTVVILVATLVNVFLVGWSLRGHTPDTLSTEALALYVFMSSLRR